jgi:hypothetical protein
VSDSSSVAVACSVGADCPPIVAQVSARTVTFSLVLDAAPVSGIDWSVTVGSHGQIESLSGEWATPASAGSYPLLSTSAAFTKLQQGDAQYLGAQPMVGYAQPDIAVPDAAGGVASSAVPSPASLVVDITGVSLGLARWDAVLDGSPGVDLVPVYLFHATNRASAGSGSYDIDVLALSPSAISFTTPTNTPGTPPSQTAQPKPGQPEPAQPGTPLPEPVESASAAPQTGQPGTPVGAPAPTSPAATGH